MECFRRTIACGKEEGEREDEWILDIFFSSCYDGTVQESLIIERGICIEGAPSTAVLDKMFK